MTVFVELISADQAVECPVCGVWVCDDCGWKRMYANRSTPQDCRRNFTHVGHFEILSHRSGWTAKHGDYGYFGKRAKPEETGFERLLHLVRVENPGPEDEIYRQARDLYFDIRKEPFGTRHAGAHAKWLGE